MKWVLESIKYAKLLKRKCFVLRQIDASIKLTLQLVHLSNQVHENYLCQYFFKFNPLSLVGTCVSVDIPVLFSSEVENQKYHKDYHWSHCEAA